MVSANGIAPELDKVISTAEPILELATGFGGGGNTEGPAWWKEGGYLLFNSIGENRRIKYTPGQGATVAKEPTNGANGLTRDPQGRLVSCEGLTRRVTREEADGSITVIANSFQGHRLNKPNDVVVKSDGSTYFTDPGTSRRCRSNGTSPITACSGCRRTSAPSASWSTI
jgi:gluconolactonase